MIRGAMAAMAGAVGEAAAGNPECPSEKQFHESAKLMPWISGQSAPGSPTVKRGVGSGADLV
jgi:hypothetical protein